MIKVRYKCAVLAVMLLTVSCGYKSELDTPQKASSQTRHMTFGIYSNADETEKNAAEYFCGAVFQNTSGAISLDVSEGGVENAAFAFWDNGRSERLCKYFPLLSEPFLYSDYEHFTMALNSDNILNELKGDMASKGYFPLAAFYTGSDFLLSTIRLNDASAFAGETLDGESEPQAFTIPVLAMRDKNKIRTAAYLGMGTIIHPEPNSVLRANELFSKNAKIAEFSFTDEIPKRQAQHGELFLTRSFHTAKPLYLMADTAIFNSLSKAEQAAVHEAVAELYDKIDNQYLSAEKKKIEGLLPDFVTMELDFDDAREAIRQKIDADSERDTDENRILEFIYLLDN